MYLPHNRVIVLTIILPDKRVLLHRTRFGEEIYPWTITREFVWTSTVDSKTEVISILNNVYGLPAFDPEKGSLLAINPFQTTDKSVHGFVFHVKTPFNFTCSLREEYSAIPAEKLLEDILLYTARRPDGEGLHSWVAMHMVADLDRQGHFEI